MDFGDTKMKKSKITSCKWCKKRFKKLVEGKLFCSLACGTRFHYLQKKIYKVYSFDMEGANLELARLEKLGQDYRFPKKFDFENKFYFGDESNAKK